MVVRLLTFCWLLIASSCISTSLLAADISVETNRNPVTVNENFQIIFTVRGSMDEEPDFSPLNKAFRLLGTSQSSQYNMINGNVSRSKTYRLTVSALQTGKLIIPAVSFGKDRSQPITVTVTNAAQSAPQQQTPSSPSAKVSDDALFITSEVDSNNPYVQQQVILTVRIYRRIQWAEARLSDPQYDGLDVMTQPLGNERSYKTSYKGQQYAVTELRYALFPQQSGDLTIQPFQISAKVATGKKKRQSPSNRFSDPFFDDFFSRSTYTTIAVQSKPISLRVKAIPETFTGMHWLAATKIQLQET